MATKSLNERFYRGDSKKQAWITVRDLQIVSRTRVGNAFWIGRAERSGALTPPFQFRYEGNIGLPNVRVHIHSQPPTDVLRVTRNVRITISKLFSVN
jgi:hypothetical protein